MEPRGIAHHGIAGGEIGMHRERRLHIGEGRDDHAPNALDGIERQHAAVTLDQPPHHLRFARRAERGADFLRLLDGNQRIDDVTALHQQPMHRLIDAIDLAPQVLQRGALRRRLGDLRLGGRRLRHGLQPAACVLSCKAARLPH